MDPSERWDPLYEDDSEPIFDEYDQAWADEHRAQLTRVQEVLGRDFSDEELELLWDEHARADTLGHRFNAFESLDNVYVEQGLEPPLLALASEPVPEPHDLSTKEGRAQYMAERIQEDTELKEQQELDEAEPVEFEPNQTQEQRVYAMAARMEQQPDEEQEAA